VAVDCFDHECKVGIEKFDHCLGPAATRVFREIAEVEKHHTDLAGVARELGRTIQQAVND